MLTTAEEFAARPVEDAASRLHPTAHAVTLAAFLDGVLVGLLALVREEARIMAHRVSVYGVSVAPAARGRGVGDALVVAAVEHARTWPGVTVLNLAVLDAQTAARRLYQRHGFRVCGRQPDAVRRNRDIHAED